MARISPFSAVLILALALSCAAGAASAARVSSMAELDAMAAQVAAGQVPVGEVYKRANDVYLALRREAVALRQAWKENAATLVDEVNTLQEKVTKRGKFVASLEQRINATAAKIEARKARVAPLQAQIDGFTANATALKAEIQRGDDARKAELASFEKKIADSVFVQNAIQQVLTKLAEGSRVSRKSSFPDTLALVEEEDKEEAAAALAGANANPPVVALDEAAPTGALLDASAMASVDPMMARFMQTVMSMSKKITDSKALTRGLKQLHDQVGDYVNDLRANEQRSFDAWAGVRKGFVADRRKVLEARWDARSHLKALLDKIEVLTDRLAELRENRASLPAIVDNLVAQIATRRKLYSTLEASFNLELADVRNELSTARALTTVTKAAMARAVSPK